jgi:hypothetical protein
VRSSTALEGGGEVRHGAAAGVDAREAGRDELRHAHGVGAQGHAPVEGLRRRIHRQHDRAGRTPGLGASHEDGGGDRHGAAHHARQ